MVKLTQTTGKEILLGSWFLGGGGGGLPEGGQAVLEQVLQIGEVQFLDVSDLKPDEVIVTASLVGSPASTTSCVKQEHYRQVYDRFCRDYHKPIRAFTTNEPGGHSVTNGWMISALTGIPMLDAACNGRAHPTGVMGAIGLNAIPGYQSLQTAAGGQGEREVGLSVTGTVETTSQLVRQAAVQAGGYVTVLRNPVSTEFFKQNASVGVISQAQAIGRHWMNSMDDMGKLLQTLKDLLDCVVLGEGRVERVDLKMSGGFDVGTFLVETGQSPLEVTFMNEYMTAERDGTRLATFPDLIAVIDRKTRQPVCSAQLKAGMEVAVVNVPRAKLILGQGMKLPELFLPCEKAIGKPMLPYIFEEMGGSPNV